MDNDLFDISEFDDYNLNSSNNTFSFDNIYQINEDTEYNNYNVEPENKDIKRVALNIQDIPRTKIQQTIPKKDAKILKPQVVKEESKLSYEDILNKMGMFVSNGKLHLKENNSNVNSTSNQYFNNDIHYSYIHNKYFKDYYNPEEHQETDLQDPIEYRNYLIRQIIHNYKMKNHIKPKKIFIPGEHSFNISPNGYADLNKLFHFPKR
jgi:hypothetical protein